MEFLKEQNRWFAALFVGAGYSAFVRLQFTTIQVSGTKTPLGIETLYEAIKSLVHRRSNRIIDSGESSDVRH